MSDILDLYDREDAVGLAEHLRRGDVTAAELLDAALARVAATDPDFNYIAQECHDRARAQARAPLRESPLAGVPFLVKDLGVDIPGVRTGSGSRYLDHVADKPSSFMVRADEAGLVTFGKTTTPELGLTVTTESIAKGKTRNPWNPERTAGGSSGGAAVAVAVGAVPLAQASDGGGSIRVPASCCGVFGLKTSRGLIPHGLDRVENWNGLSVIGPISRSVRDSAAFLDVFGWPQPGSRVMPRHPDGGYMAALSRKQRRLRIAVMPTPFSGVRIDPDVHAAIHDATLLLRRLGHHVVEDRPQIDAEMLAAAQSVTVAACTARTLAEHALLKGREATADDIEPMTAMWRHIGQTRPASELQRALDWFQDASSVLDHFFRDYDVLLSPTLAKPPVNLGILSLSNEDSTVYGREFMAFSPFATFANQTGTPAMNLPLARTHNGLPIGIMAQGRFGEDALLLQLAAELEAETGWRSQRPPLPSAG
ncbi:amidase [Sandaracinobacteroides sp. A072]|uniref:amidase n=1 Tax=Sandaracinobacteroides sp. A072 TaxID=3461146 RepID=UPI004041F0D7